MSEKIATKRIHGHKVDFYISQKNNKKYKAVVDNSYTVHFGDRNY